jgi:hypothetical protein
MPSLVFEENFTPSVTLIDWLIDWLIMVGWDWRLRTAATTGLLFIPGWTSAWEPCWRWWWWCRLGITPDWTTRALWQSYQQRHLERIGGMDDEMRISRIQYQRYLKGFLTCRKILRHETSGFTSHPKEGVLRIFIALKKLIASAGFEPTTLRSSASTLITTPPRRLYATYGTTY